MAKTIEINLCGTDRKSTFKAIGKVVIVKIGNKRVKCFIQYGKYKLTHFDSGAAICHIPYSDSFNTTKREAAIKALNTLVDRIGEDKFFAVINSAEKIN